MSETLHFRYESIGNILRLLTTIQFEKTHSMKDVSVYHQRFDKEPDEIYEKFAVELYPSGCVFNVEEIEALTKHIYRFMQKDKKTKDLYVTYDKQHMSSWVYFKIDNVVESASVGSHAYIIRNFCLDYFKHNHDVTPEYIRQFILDNFEIRSDFSTLKRIADDYQYIYDLLN